MAFEPGQIVLVDWHDALPREPNKLRPAIVVEDSALFGLSYPNVILVPLADADELVIADLALTIEPTAENGCTKRCYALSHCVTTNLKQRVRPTQSQILPEQLEAIRRQIALAIGVERVRRTGRRSPGEPFHPQEPARGASCTRSGRAPSAQRADSAATRIGRAIRPQNATRVPAASAVKSSAECAWMSPAIWPPHSISIWP